MKRKRTKKMLEASIPIPMAERPDEDLLSDAMCVDTDDARLKELGLDDSVRSKMQAIKRDYETIFSWDLMELKKYQSPMMNQLFNLREKYEFNFQDHITSFNLNGFYLKLIISYELYIEGNYKDSLLEMESVVKSIKKYKFDQSNEFPMNFKYSDACNHVARATNAYIALTLNLDTEKILKNVKLKNCLSQAEKATICTIKARVLMEYPPKGNDMALECADSAIQFHSKEPGCLATWLKAKGRVRRYYDQNLMPEKKEIDVANMLFSTKKTCFLVQACNVYTELAFLHKIKKNRNESNKYYKLSSSIISKAVELANNSNKHLLFCFQFYINCPEQFRSKTVMDELILKLSSVKNTQVYQTLGHYYKHEKNYEKAKLYLTEGTKAGHFYSYMELIKVECILKTVQEYPIVQTLNMMFDVFPSPKRRLIILSQILMYYYFYGNNPKDLIKYIKLYVNQDIDDGLKKKTLISTFPSLFDVNTFFKPKSFLSLLFIKLREITFSHEWNPCEKNAVNETYDRFIKIYQINIREDEPYKTSIQKRNNTRKIKWRKLENIQFRYKPHPAIHKSIVENVKKTKQRKNKKKKNSKIILNSGLNNSNDIYTKFDKFKINPSSKSGINIDVDCQYDSITDKYEDLQDDFLFKINHQKCYKYDCKDQVGEYMNMNSNRQNQHKENSKYHEKFKNQDSFDSSY